jgi:FlaA1/EpsC-like NDP-sugar epimerase
MEKTGKPSELSIDFPQSNESKSTASFGPRLNAFMKFCFEVLRFAKRHVMLSVQTTLRSKRLYALDMCAAVLALVLATAIRIGPLSFLSSSAFDALLVAIPAQFMMCALVFPFVGLYNRNWRYGTVSDLAVIIRAVLTESLFSIGILFFTTRLEAIPRTVVLIDALMLFSFLAAARLSFRLDEFGSFTTPFLLANRRIQGSIPILLIGAGDAADIYLRALRRDVNSHYWPVGFLDSSSAQNGLILRGVPILGSLADFDRVLAELKQRGQFPRHIIFTETPAIFGEKASEALIQHAEKLGIAVSRLAQPTELRNSQLENRFELRAIELTDLLERPQTALDHSALKRLISGRRVLVTGAGGSIGSELTMQVAACNPAEIVLIENSEFNLYSIDMALSEKFAGVSRICYLCDIRQMPRIMEIFDRHTPELIFHAAALKHVPMVEINPCEGMMTNVIGTMNIANASKAANSLAMVEISTDKVVNPTSVMGASKRIAELYCQALDLEGLANGVGPRFMTVRFGNVLGSSGSLIPLFKRQLSQGGPLTVTDPQMTRFFMTVREAVELTLQASSYGLEQRLGQGEIFVLDMGNPIKIIDVARRMIRLAGFVPDKDINIKIIGCRPGEKLYEELFDAFEKRVNSPVPGVLGAVPNAIPLPVIRRALDEIRRYAEAGDVGKLFNVVAELLPAYRNSVVHSNGAPYKNPAAMSATAFGGNGHVIEDRPVA